MYGVDLIRSDAKWLDKSGVARILVVDHNRSSLVQTASLLQEVEEHYNVTLAVSAADALKFFEARNGSFDIVMADLLMKDMHIFEFMKCIHDQCSTFMPILLMADNYPMEFAKEALVKGGHLIIKRPLVPHDVAYLRERILSVTRVSPGATSEKQKQPALISSDDKKGKTSSGRKSLSSAGEEGPTKASDLRNDHGYKVSAHLEPYDDGKRHPFIPSTTSPTAKYVGYTLEDVLQKLNEVYSFNAQNRTTGNAILDTGVSQVAGRNGGSEILREGGQLLGTSGYVTGAAQIPNQEASADSGIYWTENGVKLTYDDITQMLWDV